MNTKRLRLLFYDFEIFQYDWMVVIIDYSTRRKKVIVNNRDELIKFYELAKDNYIWIGYNSRNYDSVILKGIILGMNPKELNDKLIIDGLKPFQISKEFNKIQLYSYDTMVNRGESLKQLEGMMGHMIKESDVDFNINRKLTKDEINETIYYCTHDVEETIEVFNRTKNDFDAHFALISEFKLPLKYFNKTKAQLSAMILGANKLDDPVSEEMEYEFVDCLELDKYKYVLNWFNENRFLTYVNEKGVTKKNQLEAEIYGLKTIYGYGGFHGAIPKYYVDNSDGSIIVHSDIASLYPSLMIQYDLLSRAVKEPQKYTDILNKRLELKRAGKKKEQAPYKIVLNATYGIFKDKYSSAYDPKRANEVCVNGQLLLIDLIDKLEAIEGFELIQSNTDGLIVKIPDTDKHFEQLDNVCFEFL